MLKIYGMHTPTFWKVVMAAEELKLNYEIVDVDLMKGEQKTPEHLARHPFGKVPVIEHDGRWLWESNAIIRYLGSVAENDLYPKDVYKRALVDQWIEYFSHQTGRWITNVWFENEIAPKYFNRAPDEKCVAECTAYLEDHLPTLDKQLEGKQWITGDAYSLADTIAYVQCRGWKQAGLDLSKYKNFTSWIDRISQRDAVKKIEKL